MLTRFRYPLIPSTRLYSTRYAGSARPSAEVGAVVGRLHGRVPGGVRRLRAHQEAHGAPRVIDELGVRPAHGRVDRRRHPFPVPLVRGALSPSWVATDPHSGARLLRGGDHTQDAGQQRGVDGIRQPRGNRRAVEVLACVRQQRGVERTEYRPALGATAVRAVLLRSLPVRDPVAHARENDVFHGLGPPHRTRPASPASTAPTGRLLAPPAPPAAQSGYPSDRASKPAASSSGPPRSTRRPRSPAAGAVHRPGSEEAEPEGRVRRSRGLARPRNIPPGVRVLR